MKDFDEVDKISIYKQLIRGKVDINNILEQHSVNLAKREPVKLEEVHEFSLSTILTTMAARADEFNVKLDELGQSTVIGEALEEYFRKDSCIYLTEPMFKYLRIVLEDLIDQAGRGKVSTYMLASLSSILRLIKINLRCLSICKIDLQDIVSAEECAEF